MRFTVLAVLATLSACEMPWVVEFEQPLAEVPAPYPLWFDEVSTCVGQDAETGRFGRIRWYSSESIFHREHGIQALGLWTEPHRIVLHADFLGDVRVVKHEMVHDLLATGAHRSAFFDTCTR